MIRNLFNCISIHNGGGIVYLSLMHNDLDKKGNLILLDERARNKLKPFLHAEIKYLKKNLFRNIFVLNERVKHTLIFRNYKRKKNKNEFLNEYYLNGIPPFFRFSAFSNKVFILFQNRNLFYYLNYLNGQLFISFNFIIYHALHSTLINIFLKETDFILTQTKTMFKLLSYSKPRNKVILKDLYWKNLKLESYLNKTINNTKISCNFEKKQIKMIQEKATNNELFFYPASLDPHKNHKRLFSSFNKIHKMNYKKIILLVTLDSSQLPRETRNNKQIIFLGSQSIKFINQIYNLVDFLIFPSLNESLGLPLIEASLHNLPIIASDLDFVYDVCKPSLTFNPFCEKDIFRKIIESVE